MDISAYARLFEQKTGPTPRRGLMAMQSSLMLRAQSRALLRLTLFVLCLLSGGQQAHAVDPRFRISQYWHTTWGMQDAFPGTPTAITQTKDGYIWLGTTNGLFRFDGIQFSPWKEFADGDTLSSSPVTTLFPSRDGSLWISAGFALYRWKDYTLTQIQQQDATVEAIVEGPDGTVSFARNLLRDNAIDGNLCHVAGLTVKCFNASNGVSQRYPNALLLDTSGAFWVGGDGPLLLHWRNGAADSHTILGIPAADSASGIRSMLLDAQNVMWLGGSKPSRGLAIGRFHNGRFDSFRSKEMDSISDHVSKLFLDRDGLIWIGTSNHGLFRIDGNKVDHFDSTAGLSSDQIVDIYQDREGSIWIATDRGVDIFHDLSVATWSSREGLIFNRVRSVAATPDNELWISNDPTLQLIRFGADKPYFMKDELPGQRAGSLLLDPRRGLWIGMGLGVYLYDGKSYLPVHTGRGPNIVMDMALAKDGTPLILYGGLAGGSLYEYQNNQLSKKMDFPERELVLATATDSRGGAWVAGDRLRYLLGATVNEVKEWNPRWGYVRNLAIDGEDFVWLAATKSLGGFHSGRVQAITVANGLPCERVNAVILDAHRALWLAMQCALVKIEHHELERWWSNPHSNVKMTVFDGLDGFRGGKETDKPQMTRTPDGRLWFANGDHLQMIDPDHLARNQVPPPIHIQKIIVDGKTHTRMPSLHFPNSAKNLEIDYAGLSFVAPQRMRFRYRLIGYDTEWQDAGGRRSAFYTNLSHGTYTFEVIACNGDGVWSVTPATASFTIAPTFYQTIWFRVLLVVLLVAVPIGLDSLRVRRATERMKARLEERLEERGRIARELHDTLIQSVDGLMIYLQAAIEEPDGTRCRSMLERALDRADEVLLEGRERVHTLRAEAIKVDDIAEALRDYASDRIHTRTMEFSLTVLGQKRRLNPLVRDEVFRIGREVIANAIQHSNASILSATVEYNRNYLRLAMRDNGSGIPEQFLREGRPGHWGIAGMRERTRNIKGLLEIASDRVSGTAVSITVPARTAYPRSFGSIPYLRFLRKTTDNQG